MTQTREPAAVDVSLCPHCGTELVAHALTCPACRAIINADQLKALAATATDLSARGQLIEARDTWLKALELLPASTQQHVTISARVADLTKQIEAAGDAKPKKTHGPWWKRGLVAVATLLLLSLGKLKFLLLGLTKASTFFSMFAFFGVYWSTHGWPLALGLVFSIYIHEMGHVAVLRRLGIKAGAPLFIPGVGALVMLKQRIDDPVTDAKIGLGGPIWGLGAGLAAYAIHVATKAPVWLAIAQLTGLLNLFNLIPIWQLDGSRAFHALSSAQRIALLGVIAVTYFATQQKMLVLVGAVAVWRVFQKTTVPGDRNTLLKFSGLVAALSWLAVDF